MCRRFSLSAGLEEVNQRFGIHRVMYYYKSRYNISPTQTMPVIVQEQGSGYSMSIGGGWFHTGERRGQCRYYDS